MAAAKKTKRDSIAALFRITQNAFSKKFRVERNYKEETPEGQFVDRWFQTRGPYDLVSQAQAARTQEIESIHEEQASWVVVA